MRIDEFRKFFLTVIFIMCPRHFVKNTALSFYGPPKPKFWKDYVNGIAPKKLRNDKEIFINAIETNEPGFDFDEAEMKKFKLWPQGVIPYYIDEFSFDKVLRDRIRMFLEDVNSAAGMHFLEIPRPPEDANTRWVLFVNRRGILHSETHTVNDFTNEGLQKIVLGYDSMNNEELPEAVLAVVGVPPQHNAPNRNDYIKVIEENILPDKRHLFKILRDDEWLFHDIEYDYLSAGHYSYHKYTANGSATIEPKNQNMMNIPAGGRGFSHKDILKIRMLYNYLSKKKSPFPSVSECAKLFQPASNFKNHVSNENQTTILPRKKPNKYLGVPNDKKDDENNRNKEGENYKDNDEKEVLDNAAIDDKIRFNEKVKGNEKKDDRGQSGTKKVLAANMANLNKREMLKHLEKKSKNRPSNTIIDPLKMLSDFDSQED